MKLIFLYGPAAVGKLTVAREVAALTGYSLFDNHLSIDYAARLLEWNTPPYVQLLRALRLFTFRQMAEMGTPGLVFTFVYTPPPLAAPPLCATRTPPGSDEFIRQVLEVCEDSRIEPRFVKLEARREVLMERVVHPERKAHKKLSRPERLAQMLDEQNALSPIPFVESLTLDTSDTPPAETARRIVQHFQLPHPS